MFGFGKKAPASEPSAKVLKQWAEVCAAQFDARDPAGALARCGIALRLARAVLRARGKDVYGAWDPSLGRIELFGCDESRSDVDLVATLGHELYHAMVAARAETTGQGRRVAHGTDEAAQQFADEWLKTLGKSRVRTCAAALRAKAK